MDNHESPLYFGHEANERITKLTEVALDAMRESEYYRLDDKIAVLAMNDVTKSDWDKSEMGQGYWNFDNPRDLINTLMAHVMVIGEQHGVGIGVVEASVEIPDPMEETIRRALSKIAEEVCECPKCRARRGESPLHPLGQAIEQAMERLLAEMEKLEGGHNAEGE